jgi:hypothetical protein
LDFLASQITVLEDLKLTNSDPAILEEIGTRIVEFNEDIEDA